MHAEREVRDTLRAPLRISYTAAGRVAGAKRALLEGWMGQDGYGTSLYSGPAWPPLPSGRLGPPHVGTYALHQIALQIACACVDACVCVCLRACAGTGAAESHEEIAPARLDLPIHAAATCRFHIPVTGSPCFEGHISARMLGMECGSVHGTGSEDS